MIKLLGTALFKDRLAKRLIAVIVIISSVFSIIFSGIQIYSRYQNDLSSLKYNFKNIDTGYIHSIEESVWLFSFQQLNVILDGLSQQRDIRHLNLQTSTGHHFTRGTLADNDETISQKYPLIHTDPEGEITNIGSLEVHISTKLINQRVWQDVWFIFGTNIIKTFLVSVLLFGVFYMLVGRHLQKIAIDLGNTNDLDTYSPLKLNRETPQDDNLQLITNSLNHLLQRVDHSHQQLNDVINQLVKKNEQLESFAYISSHDLKEPIRTIMSFISLIDKKLGDQADEETKSYMNFVLDSGEQIHNLLEALLSYTKINHISDTTEDVDLNKVMQSVLKNLDAVIKTKQACISTTELPLLKGNRVLLGLVLQNLISNAIKYQPDNQLANIMISARRLEKQWVISIRDNGIGIAPQYQKLIFAPFKRLHIQSRYQGSGIGLAICAKVIEGLQGEIWVESEEGSGSTFCFTVPD